MAYNGNPQALPTRLNDEAFNTPWLQHAIETLAAQQAAPTPIGAQQAAFQVTGDDETREAIIALSEIIINKRIDKLRNSYILRQKYITEGNWADLLSHINTEGSDLELQSDIVNSIKGCYEVMEGKHLSFAFDYFLTDLEKLALETYHIDYSVYKYYPRLKRAVKYGNPALLDKILAITSIKQGNIVWL